MSEVVCYKSVVEGKVTYIPTVQIEELSELYNTIIKVQSSIVFGDKERQALTVLRVFAYNLVNSLVDYL